MTTQVAFQSIRTVFPGDVIDAKPSSRFGDGITNVAGKPTVSRAGILKYQPQVDYYYVFSNTKKYHPSVGDVVVGEVVKKTKEKYLVQIGAYVPAELDNLAFENATKKTRPNLVEGNVVYCRVTRVELPLIEVVCVSQRKMEDGFGFLEDGWVFPLPQTTCRRIMSLGCNVLQCIGQHVPFEVAVGVNGMVWVRTNNIFTEVVIESILNNIIEVSDQFVPGVVKLVWENWEKKVQ